MPLPISVLKDDKLGTAIIVFEHDTFRLWNDTSKPPPKEHLTIEFHRNFDTSDFEKEIEAIGGVGGWRSARIHIAELRAIVVGWDLLGADGKPVPITEEGLAGIDSRYLLDLAVAILAAKNAPDPKP